MSLFASRGEGGSAAGRLRPRWGARALGARRGVVNGLCAAGRFAEGWGAGALFAGFLRAGGGICRGPGAALGPRTGFTETQNRFH